ncbi:MAG: DUF790 family protein [Lentisphaerae bacterium]|nr:DUF790 family protein [Lentisphaerota bacterium]
MLNRDLLQYHAANGRISVRFVQIQPEVLNLASTLLELYDAALKKKLSRTELDDQLEPFLKNPRGGKLAAGFNKLIKDHCEFVSAADCEDPPARREIIFKTAAQFLQSPPDDPKFYRRLTATALPENTALPEDIYSDLPEFDRLQSVPPWSSADLCNLYNTALVQGLLFYADKLELTVVDTEPMVLRKFMRRLKFYRLLAEVKKSSACEIKLTLSGPAALFGENRKYGLQLAAFFPVILLLKNWKLRAVLKLRDNREDILNLTSEKCSLKSSVRRWVECLPDEVALFIRTFRNAAGNWQEAPEAELPRIAGQGIFFPDFSFMRTDAAKMVVHVELFHRYYNHALENRLDFLLQTPGFPLVVGIDRAALGKDGERQLQEKYAALSDQIFFFSNYPGAERVRKMLDNVYEKRTRLL